MIPVAHLRFCPERGRLLDLLARASSEYARLANDLLAQIGTLSPVGYRRKQEEVGYARTEAQHARDALATHKKEHGC